MRRLLPAQKLRPSPLDLDPRRSRRRTRPRPGPVGSRHGPELGALPTLAALPSGEEARHGRRDGLRCGRRRLGCCGSGRGILIAVVRGEFEEAPPSVWRRRLLVVAEADVLEALLLGGGWFAAALQATVCEGGAGVSGEAGGVEGLARGRVGYYDRTAG